MVVVYLVVLWLTEWRKQDQMLVSISRLLLFARDLNWVTVSYIRAAADGELDATTVATLDFIFALEQGCIIHVLQFA